MVSLIVSFVGAQSAPNLPTPPTTVDLPLAGGGDTSTYSLNVNTSDYTTRTVCGSGCDYTPAQWQTAINDADCDPDGWILLVDDVLTITGNFTLPDKNCASGKYVIIQTDNLAALPPDGNRVTTANSGQMPMFVDNSANSNAPFMIANGGGNYIIRGIECSFSVDSTGGCINVGDGSVTSTDQIPRNVIIDQVLVRGRASGAVRRGIRIDGANVAVINSWVDRIHETGADTQAILVGCTTGTILVDNNYMEAAGENFMVGGVGCGLPSPSLPNDITFTRNYLFKPVAWKGAWLVKNTWESKAGRRVLVKGNLMENVWVDGQQGRFVITKAANTDGDDNWVEVSDLEFSHNWFKNGEGAWTQVASKDGSGSEVGFTGRIYYHDNLATDIGGLAGWRILVGGTTPMSDVFFRHNTIITVGSAARSLFLEVQVGGGQTPTPRFAFHDNIFGAQAGSGVADNCTVNGADQDCVTSSNAYKNLLYDNGTGTVDCSNFYGANAILCTSGTIDSMGFVNHTAGNYRLAVGSLGKNAALDGNDVGITTDGYELMKCLTDIAFSGANKQCSSGAAPEPPTGVTVTVIR
jgi:hypothetical protein